MLDTRKVATEDLQIGMFVSRLDRPWIGTPFAMQGFRIENREQIEALQKYCKYVLVDNEQSGVSLSLPKTPSARRHLPLETIFFDRSLKPYRDQTDFIQEHAAANQAIDVLTDDLQQSYERATRDNRIHTVMLRQSLDPLLGSVSRNPDACVWVSRLKRHDRYTYQRALNTGIWAVALGRELGLPKSDLRSLAMGGMLLDVGMLYVPSEIANAQRPLTPEEAVIVQGHIEHGLDIVKASGIMNRDVLDMVAHHHERYNGSGYPNGLTEDRIPTFARIAGLVDTYSAITTDRGYASALSPAAAMRTLYEMRDIEFQAELVEAFIRAVGIYPAGTLVELTDGSVAVVVAEYRAHRLRPTVLRLLGAGKRPLAKPELLKLQADRSARRQQPTPGIRRSLEPDAFGIRLEDIDLHQYFGI